MPNKFSLFMIFSAVFCAGLMAVSPASGAGQKTVPGTASSLRMADALSGTPDVSIPLQDLFSGDQEGSVVTPQTPNALGLAGQLNQPRPTTDLQVAMIFYKLANKTPPFSNWALFTAAYANAGAFEKDWMLKESTKTLKDTFAVFAKNEPIIAQARVQLSLYDQQKQQFLIASFNPSTFFQYSFAARTYGVVPLDLAHQRIVGIPPAAAAKIDAYAGKTKFRAVLVQLYIDPILPQRASDYPVQLGNGVYYMITGNVINRAIYDTTGKKLLWEEDPGIPWTENTGSATDVKDKNMLLNLKTQ